MKKQLLILLLSSFAFTTFAQRLIETELVSTQSRADLNSLFALLGVTDTLEYGVNAYRVIYETPDTNGKLDTASGLVVLPIREENNGLPIFVYQHGTSSNRMDVPSTASTQEAFIIYFIAGQGMIGVAPDYLGLGESKRVLHPYLHAGTEASAAIDLVRATKDFLTAENYAFNDQLFLTGYSQGGHASMAAHKEIETNLSEEFTVTAASHMSGPYNLSNTTIDGSLADQIYDFPSYLVWMFVSYQSVYGTIYEDISSVFDPAFAPLVEQFSTGEITRGELNTLLVDQLTETYGASFANRVFQEAFLEDMNTNPDNPMAIALRDNDLYDWVPTAPTQLLYCMADEQVNYKNAVFTDSIMNANGAANVTSTDINSNGSHGECVAPAVANTAAFFLSFVEGNATSTQSINPALAFQLSPNPVSQQLQIALPASTLDQQKDLRLEFRNVQGQLLEAQSIGLLATTTLDVSSYPTGLYFVQIQGANGLWVEKVLVQR